MILIPESPRVLTVCAGGNVRSVGLAFLLKEMLHVDAVACGIAGNSANTIEALCEWANIICLMQPVFRSGIPPAHVKKIMVLDVGEDRFGNPFHPELQRIIQENWRPLLRRIVKVGEKLEKANEKQKTKALRHRP